MIFKATKENFNNVKNLMLTALKEDPLGFSSSFNEYNDSSEYWWSSYLDSYLSGERDLMLLDKEDEKIVGMSGLLFNKQERKKHVALIAWVYVLKDYRRRGIANALLNELIRISKEINDLEKLTLMVNNSQIEAIEMYKKFGFTERGVLKKDLKVGEKYLDTIIMELNLD